MKEKICGIVLVLVFAGLSLSSCKTEIPVNEKPVEETQGGEENPEAEKESKTGEVTLYLPNETADGFLTSSMILTDTPEAIVEQLVAEGAMPEGVRVLKFDKEQGVLDLSEEFADGMQQAGTTGELLYLGCVVNTFLEHYDMKSLMLYAGGEVIETGHNTYDSPMEFVEY